MANVWSYRFRRTTLWLLGTMAFLCGVGWGHTGKILGLSWVLSTLLLCSVIFRRRTTASLLLVLLFGGCFGWNRGSIFWQKLEAYQPYYGHKITLTAAAMNDGIYGTNSQMSFDANHIRMSSGDQLTGRIKLSGFGLNAVYQGDVVQATGKLYPGLGQYQARISYARVQIIKHKPSLVAEIRRRFAAGMQNALPEPLASFSMGLLIGQRATLPDDVKQDLLMVGLTHIIAVSGYNLTIMLHASKRVLGRRSKRMGTFLSVFLIFSFLLLAGSSASIVRAAIVSMLSIWASYYGRTFKPLNLILLAAAITAWANPFYVWSDISWYLSFLAFYGVLVLAPLIQQRWPFRWRDSLVITVALESICAEMMTIPFVLHNFSQISLIGLPANILVVTLVPLAMLLGLIAGLAGMLLSPLAGWFAWPGKLLLIYMLDTAHLLAAIPHVFLQNIGLSMVQMLVLYVAISVFTAALWFKAKSKSDIITDRIF